MITETFDQSISKSTLTAVYRPSDAFRYETKVQNQSLTLEFPFLRIITVTSLQIQLMNYSA